MKPIDRAFIINRLALLQRDFDKRTDAQVARELSYLAETASLPAVTAYFEEQVAYGKAQKAKQAKK